MKRIFNLMAIAILLSVFCLASASAAIIDTLDNSDPMYAAAHGQTNFNIVDQGITRNISSTGGTISWNPSTGFGVNGPTSLDDPNEIGILEMLGDGFAPALHIYNVGIVDLYKNEVGSLDEKGEYRTNGGSWKTFTGTSSSGILTLVINQSGVTSLEFRSVSSGWEKIFSDYSVHYLEVESVQGSGQVPEPGTYALMGAGLIALATFRRRRT